MITYQKIMKRYSVHAAHEIQNWVIALQNSESSSVFLSKKYLCTHKICSTPWFKNDTASGSECILITFPSGPSFCTPFPSCKQDTTEIQNHAIIRIKSKHNHIWSLEQWKNASIDQATRGLPSSRRNEI